jgi:hypothetical protein
MSKKFLMSLTRISTVTFAFGFCLLPWVGRAESEAAGVGDVSFAPVTESSLFEAERVSPALARINVLAGGFVELDLGILELKAKPYVEFRFSRRK